MQLQKHGCRKNDGGIQAAAAFGFALLLRLAGEKPKGGGCGRRRNRGVWTRQGRQLICGCWTCCWGKRKWGLQALGLPRHGTGWPKGTSTTLKGGSEFYFMRICLSTKHCREKQQRRLRFGGVAFLGTGCTWLLVEAGVLTPRKRLYPLVERRGQSSSSAPSRRRRAAYR